MKINDQGARILQKAMSDNKVYVSPEMANDLGIIVTDKRSRNPNWTDNVSSNHSVIEHGEPAHRIRYLHTSMNNFGLLDF